MLVSYRDRRTRPAAAHARPRAFSRRLQQSRGDLGVFRISRAGRRNARSTALRATVASVRGIFLSPPTTASGMNIVGRRHRIWIGSAAAWAPASARSSPTHGKNMSGRRRSSHRLSTPSSSPRDRDNPYGGALIPMITLAFPAAPRPPILLAGLLLHNLQPARRCSQSPGRRKRLMPAHLASHVLMYAIMARLHVHRAHHVHAPRLRAAHHHRACDRRDRENAGISTSGR